MKRRYFTTEQMTRIYHMIDQQPLYPMNLCLELLALTGMRTSELLLLRFQDITTSPPTANIRAAKGSEPRSAPITLLLAQRLLNLRADMGLTIDSFLTDTFSQSTDFEHRARVLRAYFGRLKALVFAGSSTGMPGLHGFRHSVAKKVCEATNHSVYAVKLALGHRKIASTERYMTAFSYDKLHGILGKR